MAILLLKKFAKSFFAIIGFDLSPIISSKFCCKQSAYNIIGSGKGTYPTSSINYFLNYFYFSGSSIRGILGGK